MKRWMAIALTLLLLLPYTWYPCAAADVALVTDEAGLVAPESLEALNDKAQEYSEETDTAIAALVTQSRSAEEPIADFMCRYYEEHSLGSGETGDAVLLTIDPQNGMYGIYLFGQMETLIGSEGHAELTAAFEYHLSQANATYADVIGAYLDDTGEMVRQARKASEEAAAELETVLREQLASKADASPEELLELKLADLPGVMDEGDLLTDTQEADCLAQIDAFTEKNGIDLLLYAGSAGQALGYSGDGVVLTVSGEPGQSEWTLQGIGVCAGAIEENRDALEKAIRADMQSGDYPNAVKTLTAKLGPVVKTGHMPVRPVYVLLAAAAVVLVAIVLGVAAKKRT